MIPTDSQGSNIIQISCFIKQRTVRAAFSLKMKTMFPINQLKLILRSVSISALFWWHFICFVVRSHEKFAPLDAGELLHKALWVSRRHGTDWRHEERDGTKVEKKNIMQMRGNVLSFNAVKFVKNIIIPDSGIPLLKDNTYRDKHVVLPGTKSHKQWHRHYDRFCSLSLGLHC